MAAGNPGRTKPEVVSDLILVQVEPEKPASNNQISASPSARNGAVGRRTDRAAARLMLCSASRLELRTSVRKDSAVWRCRLRAAPGGNQRANRSMLRRKTYNSCSVNIRPEPVVLSIVAIAPSKIEGGSSIVLSVTGKSQWQCGDYLSYARRRNVSSAQFTRVI